jgi:hypothetical protein
MLRHACGYALANAGHDTRRIQDWLGHRSIQHTTRYTQLSAAVQGLFGGEIGSGSGTESRGNPPRLIDPGGRIGGQWCFRTRWAQFLDLRSERHRVHDAAGEERQQPGEH